MKIGTLTTGAGVVTSITLTYLPEKIFFAAATQLTGLKVEVLGEGVICDLDANGLTAAGRHRLVGFPTNGYVINLADGIIKGKTVVFTFTNSAAQTPDIFAFGDNEGSIYVRTLKAPVLASSTTRFTNFGALFLPSAAAADVINITYEDGLTQQWAREDVQAISGEYQQTAAYVIDNLAGNIREVMFTSASAQTGFVMDFKQA